MLVSVCVAAAAAAVSEVMLLSEGREAFVGDAHRSMGWFASLGYPIPPNTNPADHCLDLVNADFAEPDKARGKQFSEAKHITPPFLAVRHFERDGGGNVCLWRQQFYTTLLCKPFTSKRASGVGGGGV